MPCLFLVSNCSIVKICNKLYRLILIHLTEVIKMKYFDEEKAIIDALKNKDNGSQSMRVVGRGTLVMSAKDARRSQKYKDLIQKADKIVAQK
jgi:hypothetical protein